MDRIERGQDRPVNPDNNREKLINFYCWFDDVECQAVFRSSKLVRIRLLIVNARVFIAQGSHSLHNRRTEYISNAYKHAAL